MKKVFLLLAVILLTSTAFAEEIIVDEVVGGFAVNQYEILDNSQIALELRQKIVNPTQSRLSLLEDSEMKIVVIGFADKSGTKDANREIGSKRAEQTRVFLLENIQGLLPGNVLTRTVGSEKDMRAVRIICSIVPLPKTSNKELVQEISSKIAEIPRTQTFKITAGLIAAIVVCFIALFALLAFSIKAKDKTKNVSSSQSIPKDVKAWWVRVEFRKRFCSKKYIVPIWLNEENGFWESPIPQRGSSERRILNKDPNALRRELESIPRKSSAHYLPIFKNLAKKDLISTRDFTKGK